MTTFEPSVRIAATVAALASALPLTAATPASAAPAVTMSAAISVVSPFALPQPSGPFAVGREVLHLTDRSRPDPWVPGNPRELMVSMFYPAVALAGRPAPYLSVAEARLLIADRKATGLIEPEALSSTRTASVVSAPPRRGRFPLVVLSPGFTLHRHTLTHLAEELASRGYVVATVDHAHESAGTDFPGGRTLACTACSVVDGQGTAGYARVAAGRSADLSFLLDRLVGGRPDGGGPVGDRSVGLRPDGDRSLGLPPDGDRPVWRHARMIDGARIGLAGHSIGGNAAAATMAADARVRAGINMDGTLFEPLPATGFGGRPFMLLGAPSPGGSPDRTWVRDWPLMDGWKRWLSVTGSGHLDFTDVPVIGEQAGLPDPGYPLAGSRAAQITRDYVNAFFDLHLRGIPQPLLDGPAPSHPEVLFQQQ